MTYDAIIVGGSFAGLTAALQLGRARRRVLVLDAGRPRNRFAAHAHGVLAQDGRPGADILATAAQQLQAYSTVSLQQATVSSAEPGGAGFRVQTEAGARFEGRRLLLATGVADVLPELPGLRERWGRSVLHCPYCHGYEIGGGAIGVLAAGPMSVHQASLVADWGEVTLFTQGLVELDEEARALLARRRVTVEASPVLALEGAAPALDGARLQDGRLVALRALFVGMGVRITSPLAGQLGCALDDTPLGPVLRTDARKLTSVPGVYAAGDLARAPHSISFACADGAAAGMGLHQNLVAEDALHG
jgi:thioredoxin reductase